MAVVEEHEMAVRSVRSQRGAVGIGEVGGRLVVMMMAAYLG